jgi:membrane-bound lytic murein transglycosylase D
MIYKVLPLALILSACSTPQRLPPPPNKPSVEIQVLEIKTQAAKQLKIAVNPPSLSIPDPKSALKTQSNNLWQLIVNDFRLPNTQHPNTTRAYRKFTKHPEYFKNIHDRATPYLFHIYTEVKRRNLPSELALLPVIESAFLPYAYSHGHAAGLWQIIPATGRGLGLTQNAWVDERRDILASTDAALTYLSQLNKRFKGDWLLTLAAYNAGMGTVARAIKRNKRKLRPTDFWSLDLPKETRNYVPKLLAVAQYLSHPRFLAALPELPNKPFFERIKLSQQADLAVLAQATHLSIEQIYQLNPSIKKWSTAPQKTQTILLPIGHTAKLRQYLDKRPQLIQFKKRTIRSGDTLSAIAKQNHMSLAALKQANGIKGHYLRVGKSLKIPQRSQPQAFYTHSDRQRPTTNLRLAKKHKYTIKSGDSLWRIARKYDVTVKKLAAWNQISRNKTLKPGKKLVVWVGKSGKSALQHTVRKGDSLDRISRKYRVSVSSLRKWNNLRRGGYIHPGQKLKILVKI